MYEVWKVAQALPNLERSSTIPGPLADIRICISYVYNPVLHENESPNLPVHASACLSIHLSWEASIMIRFVPSYRTTASDTWHALVSRCTCVAVKVGTVQYLTNTEVLYFLRTFGLLNCLL
jgi:hypothetical protein